jgi:hypothetical protein
VNQQIISAGKSEYFACLTEKNELYFFQTQMPMTFIQDFIKSEILVNEQEMQELKESENFENIIKNTRSIDIFGLDEKK